MSDSPVKIYATYVRNNFQIKRNFGKVKHHCHFMGKCRVASHIICNCKYAIPRLVPAVIDSRSN